VTGFQIPRNSLAWLLAAQVAVIAPHGLRLPIPITLICIVCVLWRVMVYQGRWSYPGRWSKVLLVFGGFVGVGVGYSTFLGLDPWVGLLIVAFVLKLLEMENKRDAYVVILLGYFVALTEFLYEQGIPHTLYMILVVTMITAALIGLNQTRSHRKPVATFKLASVLLLQSMPLMIVLFVLFPRLTPLWTVPLQTGIARTGVTDEMTPGNIAQLTQSDALAFRATFAGDVPGASQLYWRGLVLTDFDGETWHRREDGFYGKQMTQNGPQPEWAQSIERLGSPVEYSIIMEPTNRNWLFTLLMPRVIEANDIGMVSAYHLFTFQRISSAFRYNVTSDLDYRIERKLSRNRHYRNTRLPEGYNPRSVALAKALRAEVNLDEDYAAVLLNRYVQEDFTYTLKPPTLGLHSVDDFFLGTKSGFCEHFASSFVFMMRAAGIPARIVVGYQGGEYNPLGGYVAVHQFDAHAWAEVWFQGRGWLRFDPTAVVAPERISNGLDSALLGEDTFLSGVGLSWLKYRHTLWLTEIRLQLSAIAHYWDSWVIGYTPEMQLSLLTRYLGDLDRKDIGMIMLATFFLLLGIIGVPILRKQSVTPLSGVDREYLRFCQMLEKQGLARNVGEGPLTYAARISAQRPDLANTVTRVTDAYVEQNYILDANDETADLKIAIRAFRVRSLSVN